MKPAGNTMNKTVADNFAKLKASAILIPLGLAIVILLFLYWQHALNAAAYVAVQKNTFIAVNAALSKYPVILYNITQLGDELIFLSFCAILLLYAPLVWEAMISASLVSLVISNVLKNFFAIPRPAAVLDHHSFVIIGRTLSGHNSLPSGHSITVFTLLTVLGYAFLSKQTRNHFLWVLLIIITGLLIVITRVGVGAHYPLDVLVGSVAGFSSGLIGIFIARKYPIWRWLYYPKNYLLLMALLLVCCIVVISKIFQENLLVYYFSTVSLLYAIYKVAHVYFKKEL